MSDALLWQIGAVSEVVIAIGPQRLVAEGTVVSSYVQRKYLACENRLEARSTFDFRVACHFQSEFLSSAFRRREDLVEDELAGTNFLAVPA